MRRALCHLLCQSALAQNWSRRVGWRKGRLGIRRSMGPPTTTTFQSRQLSGASTPKQPTGIYRGTMKTSDTDDAKRLVRKQKSILDEQEKQAARRADRERIVFALGPADAGLIEDMGGTENIASTTLELRRQAAFAQAARGAKFPDNLDEVLIQPFTPDCAVLAFNAGVLLGLPRLDELDDSPIAFRTIPSAFY